MLFGIGVGVETVAQNSLQTPRLLNIVSSALYETHCIYVYIYTHKYIIVCVCICPCVCACVCVCVEPSPLEANGTLHIRREILDKVG
jgi:hypothetical protein